MDLLYIYILQIWGCKNFRAFRYRESYVFEVCENKKRKLASSKMSKNMAGTLTRFKGFGGTISFKTSRVRFSRLFFSRNASTCYWQKEITCLITFYSKQEWRNRVPFDRDDDTLQYSNCFLCSHDILLSTHSTSRWLLVSFYRYSH